MELGALWLFVGDLRRPTYEATYEAGHIPHKSCLAGKNTCNSDNSYRLGSTDCPYNA